MRIGERDANAYVRAAGGRTGLQLPAEQGHPVTDAAQAQARAFGRGRRKPGAVVFRPQQHPAGHGFQLQRGRGGPVGVLDDVLD
ncbi:hypothetical protein GCM10028822_03730 [Hymenobacter terrigena]